jgi:hypothetical protein
LNKLIINDKIVCLETDVILKAMEISFSGNLYINSLLPNDYLVRKGNGKIIILKFNNSQEQVEDLFEYDGACRIYSAKIVDENLLEHFLDIVQIIVTWNKMGKGDSNYAWEFLTTDYNKLLNNSRNDYVDRVRYKTISGVKTKYTERKPVSNKYKKDRNISVLGNQTTNGKEYRIKGEKAPYSGLYHINTKTMKAMTGASPDKTSKELIKLKKSKKLAVARTTGGY